MANPICPKCQGDHDPALLICPTRAGFAAARVIPPVAASAPRPEAANPAPQPEAAPVDEEKATTALPRASVPALAPPLDPPSVLMPPREGQPSSQKILPTVTAGAALPPRHGAEKFYGPLLELFYRAKAHPQARIIGAGAGGVLLLLLGLLIWPSDEEPAKADVPAPAPSAPLFAGPEVPSSFAAPAAEDTVVLHVVASPEGAQVLAYVDGAPREMQEAPFDLSVPRGAKVELNFSAAGHNPKQLTLTAEKEKEVKASLTERGKASGSTGGGTRRPGGGGGGGFAPGR